MAVNIMRTVKIRIWRIANPDVSPFTPETIKAATTIIPLIVMAYPIHPDIFRK